MAVKQLTKDPPDNWTNLVVNSIKVANPNPVAYRLNVNPVSNPDPFTQGLIVPSASTHPAPFNIPLTGVSQAIGIGDCFINDPNNDFTFVETAPDNEYITCNRTGYYIISCYLGVLSTLITPGNFQAAMVLLNGQVVFMAPPAVAAINGFADITPLGFPFDLASFASGSANVRLTAGDKISLVFYLQFDSCVISLTSNLSISRL
jgi:hypothetical protein